MRGKQAVRAARVVGWSILLFGQVYAVLHLLIRRNEGADSALAGICFSGAGALLLIYCQLAVKQAHPDRNS